MVPRTGYSDISELTFSFDLSKVSDILLSAVPRSVCHFWLSSVTHKLQI